MAKSKLVGEKVFSGEVEDQVSVTEKSKGKVKERCVSAGKRRYVSCPMKNCPSGPVQNITQPLSHVQKLRKGSQR